jgi:hypothetical protein
MNRKLVALALFAGTGIAMAQMTIRPRRHHCGGRRPSGMPATINRNSRPLRRMVRLGAMACQREGDIIRIGPIHRESLRGRGGGIWCRPKRRAAVAGRFSSCLPRLTLSNWIVGQRRR